MSAPVRFYFTPGCGYCVRARGLLERLRVNFEAIDVSGDHEKRAWLRKASGQSTVPQIFIGERSVGGCEELFALHGTGKLAALLEPAVR